LQKKKFFFSSAERFVLATKDCKMPPKKAPNKTDIKKAQKKVR